MPAYEDNLPHRRAGSDSCFYARENGGVWPATGASSRTSPTSSTGDRRVESQINARVDGHRMADPLGKARSYEDFSQHRDSSRHRDGPPDLFSQDVFQFVLHDPIAAHKLARFCQESSCEENVGFLHKINTYQRLLADVNDVLVDIQTTYIGSDSREQINIPGELVRQVTGNIEKTVESILPAMKQIFTEAQEHVEDLIKSDIYPRFVKDQMAIASAKAMHQDKVHYTHIGDCFCLTDPRRADDPIVFASDGFLDVTGYNRKECIPRNCRFLQGRLTEKATVQRIKSAVDNNEESVELLLNYRKNGEPFWNLLYISPLFDTDGNLEFYLGVQIDCSTTIHSQVDLMGVLQCSEEESDKEDAQSVASDTKSTYSQTKNADSLRAESPRKRSPFFKSWLKQDVPEPGLVRLRHGVGMEGDLLERIRPLSIDTQASAFHAAFSKYLLMRYVPQTSDMLVTYYSSGLLETIGFCKKEADERLLFKDIFKVLAETSPYTPASSIKDYKIQVRESIRSGKAVSFDLGVISTPDGKLTLGGKDKSANLPFSCHWTPLKDEVGKTGWVMAVINQG